MREAKRQPRGGHLLDHPAAHAPPRAPRESAVLQDAAAPPHDLELELGPRDGRELEQIAGLGAARRESRWLTTSRTLSGLPSSVSGRRKPGSPLRELQGAGLDQGPPELGQRKALPSVSVADRLRDTGELGARVGAGGAPGRTRRSPPRSGRRDGRARRLRSAQVGERVGSSRGTSASVSRNVASSSMRASAADLARWRRRSSVGPSAQCPSSSDEEHRLTTADAREEIGHGCVEAMALRVRIGDDRAREVTGPRGRSGGAASARRRHAEIRTECRRVDLAHELVERFDERLVRASGRRRRRRRRAPARLRRRPRARTRGRAGSCPSPARRRRARPVVPPRRAAGISVRSVVSSWSARRTGTTARAAAAPGAEPSRLERPQ